MTEFRAETPDARQPSRRAVLGAGVGLLAGAGLVLVAIGWLLA